VVEITRDHILSNYGSFIPNVGDEIDVIECGYTM
jgi:hypothetical protein